MTSKPALSEASFFRRRSSACRAATRHPVALPASVAYLGPVATKKPKQGRPRKATNAFGRWLVEAQLTSDAVATKLGVSESFIEEIARNEPRPDLELALKIERAVEVASFDIDLRGTAGHGLAEEQGELGVEVGAGHAMPITDSRRSRAAWCSPS